MGLCSSKAFLSAHVVTDGRVLFFFVGKLPVRMYHIHMSSPAQGTLATVGRLQMCLQCLDLTSARKDTPSGGTLGRQLAAVLIIFSKGKQRCHLFSKTSVKTPQINETRRRAKANPSTPFFHSPTFQK